MNILSRTGILTFLGCFAVAVTSMVASSAYANDMVEAIIHPLCLWDLSDNTEKNETVAAYGKRHIADPITIKDGVLASPMADELNPNYPDEIRATRLGRLRDGGEVFLVTSMRYGMKMEGTKVVIWRWGVPTGGTVAVVASSGSMSQGGIAAAFPLADQRIQIDFTFDSAWLGIDESWVGVPEDFRNAPTFGIGCAVCGIGVAHVLYPSAGSDRPVLKSIEIFNAPEGNACRAKQLLAKAGSFPHTFTPQQFRDLITALETCPDEDTRN